MNKIHLRPFEQNINSQTFQDSVRLMQSNFTDPTATSAAFLDWLYLKNPYKKAIGYIAYDGDIPISQLFMIFQPLSVGKEVRSVGILSNLCTEKNYRNKGLFSMLIHQLLADAKQLNIPFVWDYPNPSSLHGFQKAGFKILKNLSFEISPVSLFSLSKDFLSREKISILGETQDVELPIKNLDEFESVSTIEIEIIFSQKFSTPLDTNQLQWRYLNHPTRKYYALKHSETNEIIILRVFKIFGFRAAAIMKQSTFDPPKWNRIISSLKKILEGHCSLILNISNTKHRLLDHFHNRFVVPTKLSPRLFPLAIYPIENISLDPEDYVFSFGDYEAL